MICVSIGITKDKRDRFIMNLEGEILADAFTIPNSMDRFELLLDCIRPCACNDEIKVGPISRIPAR